MKRIIAALLALMILLSGCTKEQQSENNVLVATNSYYATLTPIPAPTDMLPTTVAPMPSSPSDTAVMENLVSPEPTVNVQTLDNVVHEFGESSSLIESNDTFSCTIQYPITQMSAVDKTIKNWAEDMIDWAHQEVEKENDPEATADINVSYNTYLVGNQFSSIEETGFFNASFLTDDQPIIQAFNIDMQKKRIIANDAIFEPSKTDDILALLKDKLLIMFGELTETDLSTIDATWLEKPLIQAEGIELILEAGKCLPASYGTQKVLLSYDELGADSLAFTEVIPSENTSWNIPEETNGVGTNMAMVATAGGALNTNTPLDPEKPMVALTFDDGPSKTTTKILKILSENGGHATFFVVGNRVYDYADTVNEIINQGSEVGSHTWDHKKLTLLSNTEIAKELKDTNDIVYTVSNVKPKVLRPPYGSVDDKVKSVAKNEDMAVANWSIDTLDWKTKNAQKTYDAIMKDVKDGSIILSHDLHPETGDAMEKVIPELVRRGYQLVTVSELIEYKKGGFETGKLYP